MEIYDIFSDLEITYKEIEHESDYTIDAGHSYIVF